MKKLTYLLIFITIAITVFKTSKTDILAQTNKSNTTQYAKESSNDIESAFVPIEEIDEERSTQNAIGYATLNILKWAIVICILVLATLIVISFIQCVYPPIQKNNKVYYKVKARIYGGKNDE